MSYNVLIGTLKPTPQSINQSLKPAASDVSKDLSHKDEDLSAMDKNQDQTVEDEDLTSVLKES